MTSKLFIGSLSYNVTDSQLAAHFASAGTVLSARAIIDRDSGQGKGFGFVEMLNPQEAAQAIRTLNNSTLDGRNIVVKEANPPKERN